MPFPAEMKIALTHDYLNQFGGAERVLELFAEMYPDAPIYTLFYDKEPLAGRFENRIAKTSFLDHSFIRKNHRAFIPFMPIAAHSVNLGSKYDVVISNSVGFGKAMRHSKAKHIFYCNALLRYAWDPETHLKEFLPEPFYTLSRPIAWIMKLWDRWTGRKSDIIVANSEYTRDRIKKFYNRDSEVIYPPVDTKFFHPTPNIDKKYYLAVGRLIPYKKFDIIVEAFNKLDIPVKIVGDGREYEKLKSLASSSNIEFTGFIHDPEKLRDLYVGAKAFLFPQIEDFGLVAAEALACGTPVLGYAEAGAKEMVIPGKNGLLFNEQSAEELIRSVTDFEKMSLDPESVAETAQKFSRAEFERRFRILVGE
ncbi:MAG: glycosyltransferase [Candidatus Colwellbacteria bacterium]|nr:glycosyltransferase [Candidatus Colwellbacteria bacterium]